MPNGRSASLSSGFLSATLDGTAPPIPREELFSSIRMILPKVLPLSITSQTAHSSSDVTSEIESITCKGLQNRAFRMGAFPSKRRFTNGSNDA